MFGRRVLLFLLVVFLSLKVHAEVFTVTNNADSGPGTLREALTLAAANGSGEKDFINFNIADLSEAGRTITLLSELPYASSNLVIDASTQPGAVIKMSDAKVAIVPEFDNYVVPLYESGAFTLRGVNHVEIYGFFISGFRNLKSNFPSSASIVNAGIIMINADHIIIGAPRKGNIFSRNLQAIYGNHTNYLTADFPHDVVIQSNYIGYVNDDGHYEIDAINFFGDNFTFGGDNPVMGNHILGYLNFGSNNGIIKNNLWGLDKNGIPITENNSSGTLLPKLNQVSPSNNLLVSDNVWAIIYMGFNSATNFQVVSNKALTMRGGEIELKDCANGTIGTDDVALVNTFLNGYVYASNCKNVEVRKNSFTCVSYAYHIINPQTIIPQIQILVNNDTEFSGTAAPNSDIYVYNDNTNCDVCSPVEYFATAKASPAGTWKITGDFTTKKLLANATQNNNSSEYTTPFFAQAPQSILQPSCGLANGSVKLATGNQVLLVEWFDASDGHKIGQGFEIKGLGPGRYYAKGFNGKCFAKTADIYLTNQEVNIEDAGIQIVQPSCGNTGSIKGLYAIANHPVTYVWTNQNNYFITNNIDLIDAPAGTYTFNAQDNVNGCSDTYPPITLTNTSNLAVDESAISITPTKCYEATGAITGITATGTGTLKYSWKNEQNSEVGTTANLIGQPSGKYILSVTDESSCGAVYSTQREIPSVNDITIDIATRTVTNATCENGDGSIKNVTVTPNIASFTYVWTNERNEVKGNLKDLSFVQAGTYTLTVSGGSLCAPIISEPITIGSDNGVQLIRGASYKQKTDFCGKNTGEITGLEAPAATTFLWLNTDNNTTAGHSLNLVGVAGGHYRLTYSNATCSNYSDFEILSGAATIFTGFIATATKSCYALNNGSISLNTDNAPEQPVTYRWINAQGTDVAFAKTAIGLSPGKYKVILTNQNNCPYIYAEEFTVGEYPQLVTKPGTPTNIQCGVGTGSISASVFTGGSANYTYQWYDEAGNALPGQTKSSINNLAKGKYRLHVEDGTCAPGELDFEIKDESVTPTTPEAKDIKVYGNGSGTIVVTAPFETAIYRLYDAQTSPDAIAEVRGGKFNVTVTESRSYFITLAYGYCESARREVKVTLVTSGITNTITPNGDGINDYWNLAVISDYPTATINIYTRYGQPVYQSVGYAKPFDGTNKGKQLPAGVYYYIIDLKDRNILSGYITIIR